MWTFLIPAARKEFASAALSPSTLDRGKIGATGAAGPLESAFVLTDLAEEAAWIAYFSRLADLTE